MDLHKIVAAHVWRRITVGMLVLFSLLLENFCADCVSPLVATTVTSLLLASVLFHEGSTVAAIVVFIHIHVGVSARFRAILMISNSN